MPGTERLCTDRPLPPPKSKRWDSSWRIAPAERRHGSSTWRGGGVGLGQGAAPRPLGVAGWGIPFSRLKSGLWIFRPSPRLNDIPCPPSPTLYPSIVSPSLFIVSERKIFGPLYCTSPRFFFAQKRRYNAAGGGWYTPI